MYVILVDEARDNSCTEQMSLCVRYVNQLVSVVRSLNAFWVLSRWKTVVGRSFHIQSYRLSSGYWIECKTLHCSGLRRSIRNVRHKQRCREIDS